jgi:hypothetical protein
MPAAPPVLGQAIEGTTTLVSIDAPIDGERFNVGQEIEFGGWAADPAGPGTGVDSVEVVLNGLRGAPGATSLGTAVYGSSRADVAQAYGKTDFTNSGYNLLWRVAGTSGRHTAHVYAHSIANGWRYRTVSFEIIGPAAAPARTTGGTSPYGPQSYGPQMGQYGGGMPYDPYNPTGTGYGPGRYGGYGAPPPPPPPIGGYGAGYGFPGYGYGAGYGGGYQTTTIVTAPPGGSLILNWTAVPNAQSYRIYQAPITAPNAFTVIQTVTQAAGQLVTNATISSLTAGQVYYLQVRAVDATGLETTVPSSALGGGGFPGYGFPGYGIPGYGFPGYFPGIGQLSAPVVTLGTRTQTTIQLTWTAVPGAASYRVEQAPTAAGPFNLVTNPAGTTTATTIVVAGLPANTAVAFRVVGVDVYGFPGLASTPIATSTLP